MLFSAVERFLLDFAPQGLLKILFGDFAMVSVARNQAYRKNCPPSIFKQIPFGFQIPYFSIFSKICVISPQTSLSYLPRDWLCNYWEI